MTIDRRDMLIATSAAMFASTAPVAAAPAPVAGRRQAAGRQPVDVNFIVALTQLMTEWAHEVDTNFGRAMVEADLLTPDCRCKLDGQWVSGRAAIGDFYKSHAPSLKPDEPAPVLRQLLCNLRPTRISETEARITLNVLLFLDMGTAPIGHCNPREVADVRVDCRLGGDGLWRISMFDSDRAFRRD